MKIIKNNAKPTDFPVKHMEASQCKKVYSSVNLADASLTLPTSILSTFTDISK